MSGIPVWPSRDPIGENFSTGEFNCYAFIANNGVAKVDRLGLQEFVKPKLPEVDLDFGEEKQDFAAGFGGIEPREDPNNPLGPKPNPNGQPNLVAPVPIADFLDIKAYASVFYDCVCDPDSSQIIRESDCGKGKVSHGYAEEIGVDRNFDPISRALFIEIRALRDAYDGFHCNGGCIPDPESVEEFFHSEILPSIAHLT